MPRRMSYCCIPKCKSNAKRKVPGISFHEIPSDAEVRAEWLRRIPRKDWVPNTTSRYSVVCSKHFIPSDFKEGCKIRMLKKGAIPSLFDVRPESPAKRSDAPDAVRKREAAKPHPGPVASQPPPVVGRAAVHSTGDDSSSRHPIQPSASSMMYCAIPGCCSQVGVTRDVVFHEFPSNAERRESWTLVVRALRPPSRDFDDPWVPSEYAKICSKHFTPDDYIQARKKRYLAPHATPSLFLEAWDAQTPGHRGRPRKQRRARDSSSTVVVNESLSKAESSERPPISTTTTPVVIRHLLGDSSHSKRDHQGTTDSVSMRISNVVSSGYADVRLSAETLEPSENADPHVRLGAVNVVGSRDQQTPDVVPLLGSRAVALSIGCQTHVTGLTIEAYEEQIHSLKNECKRLRAELCALRCLGVNTICGGSVTSKHSANLNTNI
ncbi:uncharacterized protein LOC119399899 [Rhipicephalus sanguineus]|uniref:uncharacterized protein LOC119399899 n=1 Tax=Rhipicephalus sanguineus TaxID=34632 RepID=UPI001892DC05|nr:uncharacterized protein LOC119399899 [Rhipicephalus sanguineus]